MYIRLTVTDTDTDSHRPQGIFVAAGFLLDNVDMTLAERQEIHAIIDWFNENLGFPSRAQRRKLSHRAVFWFRSSEKKYIKKAWELAQILRAHGFVIEVMKAACPGSVVFADSVQIASVYRA